MNPIKSITEYVRSSIAELKKVTWPTKEMTIKYTGMVVVVSIAAATFFAVLDFGFSKVVTTALTQKTSAPAAEETPVVPDLEPDSVETTPVPNNGEVKLDLTTSTAQ